MKRFTLSRQRVLGVTLAVLLGLTMAGPAAAQTTTNGTVSVTGSVGAVLQLTINPTSISFGGVAPGTCATGNTGVTFTVTTNVGTINGTVSGAASTGSVITDVSNLRWGRGGQIDCTTGTPVSGTASPWFSGVQVVNGSYSETDYYALNVPANASSGIFGFDLTYVVTAG